MRFTKLLALAILGFSCTLSYGQGVQTFPFGNSGGGSGGGATIPFTTNVLKGDNAGNAIGATPCTDFVTLTGCSPTFGTVTSTGNINGVSPTVFGFIDATSSVQTQINSTLKKAANLSDIANLGTARTNLGFPSGTGVLCNTSTTASGICNSSNIQSAIGAGVYDTSGAAASALTAAETYSSNASNITTGTLSSAVIPTNINTTGNAATATTITSTLPITKGGTGGTTILSALTNFGIPQYPILAYGAVCDGTTDDTTAISAAITAATAVNGKVIVPNSVNGCNVTTMLTIPLNVHVSGPGMSSPGINCKMTTGVCVLIAGSSSTNGVKGGGIDNLTIMGPYAVGGPFTGNAVGVWIGGDPAGTVAPSTWQGNFITLQNLHVAQFAYGYEFGNNAYIIDWINQLTTDNNIGYLVPCCSDLNSGEHLTMHGGSLIGGIGGVQALGGGGGTPNPTGANFEFNSFGMSWDYVNGPTFDGPRLTVHLHGDHVESSYTPFFHCHESTAGTGACIFDSVGSTFVLWTLGPQVGSDAPFYMDATFSNFALPEGNYLYLSRTQAYVLDWAVPFFSGTLSTLNIAYPWGMDANFSSTVPASITNADLSKWGTNYQTPIRTASYIQGNHVSATLDMFAPVITASTELISPLIYGGSATSSGLTLKASNVGGTSNTNNILLQGANGANSLTIDKNGDLFVGGLVSSAARTLNWYQGSNGVAGHTVQAYADFGNLNIYNPDGSFNWTVGDSAGFFGFKVVNSVFAQTSLWDSFGRMSGTLATIPSATTITFNSQYVTVSGTNGIATITPFTTAMGTFSATYGGCYDVYASGNWSTTTSGNISTAFSAVTGTLYRACWLTDSKWHFTPIAQPGTATPVIDGTGTVGVSLLYSRQDHVHPTDTTRAPLASPTFTGVPAAPTAAAGTNTTQVSTTAFTTAAIAALNSTGLARPIRTVTATTDTATVNDYAIKCNATTASSTETLPAAPTQGQIVVYNKIDSSANTCTVSAGAKLIRNGATTATTLVLSTPGALILQYDSADGSGVWTIE